MKKIIMSPDSGFCFGVKRAVDEVESAIRQYKNKEIPIYTLGPIVHNEKVVADLAKRGASAIESFEGVPPGCLVIRSHGVASELIAKAQSLGFNVVDATCPFVKKIHNIVTALCEENIPVIVIGKKDHPEVCAIVSYAGSECNVINSPQEALALPYMPVAGIVVQTTKTKEEFENIIAVLKTRIKDCRIHNTICFETVRRQKSLAALARNSDLVIISGGRHSSNTNQLFAIASSLCPKAYLVEEPEEMDPDWLTYVDKIGLASGASTPIEELEKIREIIQTNI